MVHNQKQTAIMLFAFSSEKEANRKVFEESEQLFQQLNRKTLLKAQKTNVDVVVITEEHQIGATFGERFANAIQSVFNKGYEQIITLGNDSPNLKTSHLLKALHSLQNDEAALGPSFDGGTYLIALKRTDFVFDSFKNISWNTFKVFSELKSYFATQNTHVRVLSYLADIDSRKDVFFYIHQFKKSISFLQELLRTSVIKIPLYSNNFYVSKKYASLFFNKGSPNTL
ncbi:conserved protein of unknown function [Tenacibaculum sp. 190130A14a]|uniref:DUF2064 domain-containing protein n=1 Tax=Tenacibaculum polynesiense TaxID=3137857 RepID=A0ABM9PEE5_9FLAO